MRRSRTRGRTSLVALLLCAAWTAGCAWNGAPRIDPTGEHVFVSEPPPPATTPPPNFRDEPGSPLPWNDVAVMLSPRVTVAPVGSEVVLLAGVRGADNYLRTNRRLEWSLGGVGNFIAVGQSTFWDLLLGDFNAHRRIDSTFAVGSTSRQSLRLHRGSATPGDDVYVLSGQGWITATSPVEGTSYVTVFAPEVYPWDARTQSATIHWVDAQWRFPPPAINPAGTKHTLTTVVTRQSDQTPCTGWRVHYTIAGGPPAGFVPDGAPSVEVPTDAAGQASVEIFQKQPSPGTNRIAIEIIRPAELGGPGGRRLVIGSGSTMKTWTAAALAVQMTGPAVGSVGATLTYRADVSNAGDQPARDVVLTQTVPEGLTYLRSTTAGEVAGKRLQWRLGPLNPGQHRLLEMNFRAERSGSITLCAEATSAGGPKAAHCTATTIAAATLDLKVTGPAVATVGSQVDFQILIVNRSPVPATRLLIKDRFDPGLEHEAAKSPIERDLGSLAPGQSHLVRVTFRVTRPGRLCHTVEVTGAGGVRAAGEGCVTVAGAPAAAPPPAPPTGPPTGPPGVMPGIPSTAPPPVTPGVPTRTTPPVARLSATVKRTTSENQAVGDTAQFVIDVSNTGERALSNLRLVAEHDAALRPSMATAGNKPEANSLVWTIDSLPPGKTAQYEMHCLCQTAAAKACVRVTVTAPEAAQASGEACLTVRAAPSAAPPAETPPGKKKRGKPEAGKAPGKTEPGTTPSAGPPSAETPAERPLTMTVEGLFNPITAGKDLTYRVDVKNDTQAVDRLVMVTVTVPEGMVPVPLGTTGPSLAVPHIQRQTVRFDPIPELRPGQTLQYYVRVHTRQPGQYRLRAELTSQNQPQPLVVEEKTEVLPSIGSGT